VQNADTALFIPPSFVRCSCVAVFCVFVTNKVMMIKTKQC